MCNKAILENGGRLEHYPSTIQFVPKFYKIPEMCVTAVTTSSFGSTDSVLDNKGLKK